MSKAEVVLNGSTKVVLTQVTNLKLILELIKVSKPKHLR